MGLGHSPRIITENLVLLLDAANPRNFDLTKVEVLVVGGGGAGGGYGGNDGAGGGGAGGLIYNSNFAVTPGTQLAVQVGAGGAGVGGAVRGNNGNDSIFGALTATGGGGGGSEGAAEQRPGASGGSGGGGGGYGSASGIGGNGTAGQGNRGGDCTGPGDGGGGGAGAAGQSGLTGIGGIGLAYSISGTSTYYAGGGGASGDKRNTRGGGGALGGLGGGGKGQDATNSTPPENGTNATGGGGGAAAGSNPTHGAGTTLTSGSGGSGIVIVRYPGPQKAIGGTVTSVGGDTIHTFTTSGNFTPLVNTNGSAVLGLSDLSGNRNFGTTANGPTYSSANGGSLVFDGTNDYVTTSLVTSLSNNVTISSWFRTFNASQAGQMVIYNGSDANGNGYGFAVNNESTTNGEILLLYGAIAWINTGFFAASNVIYNATMVIESDNSNKLYINGNLVHSGISRNINTPTNHTEIGRNDYPAARYFNGNIAQTQIYNRALSAAEIAQNYNALRGRYGL